MSNRDSYPLNLEQRRSINASERELDDLQQKLMEEQSGDAEDGEQDVLVKDLVLRETLNILGDMILLNKGRHDSRRQHSAPATNPHESSGDPLIDWLKSGR